MELETTLIIAFAAFATSVISGVAGFGGGIAMIVAFSLFFDIKTTIALSSIYYSVNNLNKCVLYRQTVDWQFIRYLFYGAFPAVLVGLVCFYYLPPYSIAFFLGCMGLYLVVEHFVPFLPRIKKFTPLKISTMGVLWGFTTGAANGMPLKVMLLKWRGLTKHLFVGTSAVMSFVVDLLKLVGYCLMGFLVLQDFITWLPIFIVVSFCGTWLGRFILNKISTSAFEWTMLSLIFVGSIKLMFFS